MDKNQKEKIKIPDEIFKTAKAYHGNSLISGVYFVSIAHFPDMEKQRLVYIGSSKNMRKRAVSPSHPYRKIMARLGFGYVALCYYYPCYDFLNIEKECIKHFKPALNKQHKNG